MRLFLAAVAILYLAGCETIGMPGALMPSASHAGVPTKLQTPAVIAVDFDNERLVYWPMSNRGSSTPAYLSRRLGIQATGMVANGDVVTIASYDPPELLSYNVVTGATSTISDKYGDPVDVAIGKTGTLYALHASSVGVFPAGSSSYDLSCRYVRQSSAIAVDNEGDVFVNSYSPRLFGVAEYAAGSSKCVKLRLKVKPQGYLTGLGVDPKTDDLIVEDWVGCAGGEEGRITVYERPYGSKIVGQHHLHASCPVSFRLDATSSRILVVDGFSGLRTRVHGCNGRWIDQRPYLQPMRRGTYAGGCSGAVTTIPNTLPN